MSIILAQQALLTDGWHDNVTIEINQVGAIKSVGESTSNPDIEVGILLPSIANVHSHSFQRAMAGLAEKRGPGTTDDFWTWRKVMYRFLELLTPEDIEAIAAQVQMEMLEAGFASQAEFHYVHHAPNGVAYDQVDETSQRHLQAALMTGMGYTHLPVLYMQGGLDGRQLDGGQLRFGCGLKQFSALIEQIRSSLHQYPKDFRLGVAPHSLRAVSTEGLDMCVSLADEHPIHIHAAEQIAEVQEVERALKARPVRWLLDNQPVDSRWCLIHATHLDDREIVDLARSRAVAGLCPITEANLGDGIFDAEKFIGNQGTIGIGSDSNVRISLNEELRALETSQRLRERRRLILTNSEKPSNGRMLYNAAAKGGAQAIGRNSGSIQAGALADLVALDEKHIALAGLKDDTILDTWIFASGSDLVSDVWSAGRHVVKNGRHVNHYTIRKHYKETIQRLRVNV